jgi:hypothetical protein
VALASWSAAVSRRFQFYSTDAENPKRRKTGALQKLRLFQHLNPLP